MMRLLDLAGRTAIITGSSAGIGAAVSNALRLQGCSVIGLDITPPPSSSLSSASTISSSTVSTATNTNVTYGQFTYQYCDVRNPDSIHQAISPYKSLDYVVNVVGIDPKYSLSEGGPDQWSQIIDTNLRSQYLVIRSALSALEQGQGKSIVNISSINSR